MSTSAHEEILDDLPALLTGELTPARERAVAEHLDGCDPCRRELAVIARASAWLQDAARLEMTPSADELSLGEETPNAKSLPPLQLPKHSWSPRFSSPRRSSATGSSGRPSSDRHTPLPARWLATAAAVILLVVGVLGGVLVGRASNGASSVTSVAALHPVPGGVPVGSVVGEAKLGADGGMHLSVNGLPNPPGQDFYEVWLFDPSSRRMLAVGVLPPNGKGSYSLPTSAETGYNAVEVSLEPNDGDPAHSQLSVLRGTLA